MFGIDAPSDKGIQEAAKNYFVEEKTNTFEKEQLYENNVDIQLDWLCNKAHRKFSNHVSFLAPLVTPTAPVWPSNAQEQKGM